ERQPRRPRPMTRRERPKKRARPKKHERPKKRARQQRRKEQRQRGRPTRLRRRKLQRGLRRQPRRKPKRIGWPRKTRHSHTDRSSPGTLASSSGSTTRTIRLASD